MDVITEGKAEEESTGLDEQREEGNTMEKEERPSALDPTTTTTTTTTTRRNSDSGLLLGVGTRTTPGGGRLERPLNNNYQTTPQERRRRRKVQSDTAAVRWMQHMDHHDNNMSIRSQFNSTRQGRLSTRDFNFGVPTKEGAKEHVQETHGTHHWRARVLEVLHSNLVQYVMMGLLLLDIFILFTELFLLSTYPMCYTIERDAISCCPVDTSTTDGDETLRWLAGGDGGHDDDDHHAAKLCDDMDGFYPMYDYPVGCDSHKWERVHTAEFALFILTMLILSSMFLELNIEMIVLTPKVFFKQFWFALDYVIIGVSLTLDVLFHSLHYDSFQYYIGLLVGIRLWRFVRIGHGIVALTSEATHAHYEHLLCYAEELEVLLKENHVELPPSSANVKRHEDFMALIQEGAHEEEGDEEEEEKKEKG